VKFTLPQSESRLREFGTAVFDLGGLLERLEGLSDRRGERGRRYELAPLLLLVVLAKLAGEDTPSGIADWVAARTAVLTSALRLEWARMPHHNTFRRLLAFVLEPEELDRVVSRHLIRLAKRRGATLSHLIAFDGKTPRGTICQENPDGSHLLAAYLPGEGIVLGQVAVANKENEILAAPVLLGSIDLRNKVVIGDAMHSQRALSKQIRKGQGDFVWLIKENQPAVLEDLEQHFAAPTPTVLGNYLPDDFSVFEQREKGHGRKELRRITTSSELKGYTNWPDLEQVFRLERERVNLRTGEVEREVVYGLTSLSRKRASARLLLGIVRAYWGIENGLHNRRDVTFREDRTRLTLGYAGHVMASLNNLVIGLFRLAGFTNLAHARRFCSSLLNHPTYLTIEPTLT
jgi:predicted transposase YbfD/YdcC